MRFMGRKLKNKGIIFDITLNGRYVCSMSMEYDPRFPISQQEWVDFVVKKRPDLRGKDFRIEF